MLDCLPCGCNAIDLLLGGGFEAGIITQIYGESGTGKSNIAMQLAVQAVSRGLRVIFIDTEGFSGERFKQIAGPGAEEMAKKIMVFEPMSLEQQAIAIRESSRIAGKDLGLVILDSATSFTGLAGGGDNRTIRRTLNLQLSELQEMGPKAQDSCCHNQPGLYRHREQNPPAAGSKGLEHMSKAIILLEKRGGDCAGPGWSSTAPRRKE